MKVNYHFHSRVSFDAEYPLAEMCRAAREAGQRHLCVTDHCDLIDEYGKPDDSFDWSRVDEELRQARAMFPDLEIRRGVELGQALLRPESAERVLREPGIDFVLGSMHNTPAGLDYYWTKFTDRRQCLEILEQYLNYLLQLSGTDFFDSLAHLTYPIRYMRFRDGVEVDFHPFDDLILEILRTLAERGKALGLNAAFVALGNITGPSAGGFILNYLNWHWLFLIMVPVALLLFIFQHILIPSDRHFTNERIDCIGSLLFVLSVSLIFYGFQNGSADSGASFVTKLYMPAGLVFFVLFIIRQLTCRYHVLDLSLFQNREFDVNLLCASASYVSIQVYNIIIPFYFQYALSMNAGESGLYMSVYPVILVCVAPLSGMISDKGRKK